MIRDSWCIDIQSDLLMETESHAAAVSRIFEMDYPQSCRSYLCGTCAALRINTAKEAARHPSAGHAPTCPYIY